MSKAGRVAHLCVGNADGLDPHYAGWFACFNRGEYFEAHDVLETLWLGERSRPNARFYQALIQLAGAFVHLQKNRLRPADALFVLAENNLAPYPEMHERLHLRRVRELIRDWRGAIAASNFAANPLNAQPAPSLHPGPVVRTLEPGDPSRLVEIFRAAILVLAAQDYAAEDLAAWAAHPERLLAEGRLVGPYRATFVAGPIGNAVAFLTFEADGHIDLLYTHPDHARRGAATALLFEAEAVLRARRCGRLFAEASLTARPCFERSGFSVIASQTVPLGERRQTNFRMEKRL